MRPFGARLSRPGSASGRARDDGWERGVVRAFSSCLLIAADGLEEAVALARSCPAVDPGCVEVLELDPGTGLGRFAEVGGASSDRAAPE